MDYLALQPLLSRALCGYRNGRVESTRLTSAASGMGFDEQLEALLSARLSLDERLLMRVSSSARSRALVSARSNHLTLAREALQESLDVLSSDALSTEGRLVLVSFHEAVEAYLEYKSSRNDEARRRVFKALEADGTLITAYQYAILELHRIQLCHNLMRIKAREAPAEAAHFCSELLRYVEGDQEGWPLPEFRNVGSPRDLPADLLAAMFVQITGELALLLAGRQRDDASAIFEPLMPLVETYAGTENSEHKRAKAWLKLKSSFVRGDIGPYLQQVAPFLQEGPGDVTLLWRAAAADLYVLCNALESAEAHTLRREICLDAEGWRPLPYQIKAVFTATGCASQHID